MNILKVYTEQYEGRASWSEEQWEIVKNVMDRMLDGEKIFEFSEEARSHCIHIQARLEEGVPKWTDQLYLLADIVEALELLEKDL